MTQLPDPLGKVIRHAFDTAWRDHKRKAILDLLPSWGSKKRGLTRAQIANRTFLPAKDVGKEIQWLKRKGRVRKSARGVAWFQTPD